MTVLFTTFYKDNKEVRQRELNYCLLKNIEAGFSEIVILVENESDYDSVRSVVGDASNVIVVASGERPTFRHFINLINDVIFPDDIAVISNTDIFFDSGSVYAINSFMGSRSNEIALALSRWDFSPDKPAVHFERADSQDVWVFKTPILKSSNLFNSSIDFPMGIAGCDNRLAHELAAAGYTVINPSKTIKTYHYHDSQVRNYISKEGVVKRVPPPYLLVNPE